MASNSRHRIYWSRTRGLTVALLLVWFGVTFGVVFFARDLTFTVLGWPFSFYMAGQGCLVIYLMLTWVYATRLRRMDIEYGVEEAEDR
jgi:putative solute:sodium symporter small subunit